MTVVAPDLSKLIDEQEVVRFLARTKTELKQRSKNDLIKIIQELSVKVAILENIVDKALGEQNKQTAQAETMKEETNV